MMERQRIVIVGNSASAWMTAVCLDAVVNDGGFRPAEITVVGRDEVRENPGLDATLPDLRHVVAVAGIDENEFLKRTGGTFSHGIQFTGWRPEASWYHVFDRHRSGPIDSSGIDWLASDHGIPFAATVSVQPALCEAGISPRPLPGVREFPRLDYGFHLDDCSVAGVFRELAVARGVSHVADGLAGIERDHNELIVAVSTASGLKIDGNLFIDCTGTDALLIGEKLGVPWVDCSASLASDRVASIEIPYEQHYPGRVRPYTLVAAVPEGYVREIPLQDRLIRQCTYSSAITDDETAALVLRDPASEVDRPFEIQYRSIASGYRAKPWAGNCVAIGSSFAGIEPVSSTGPSLCVAGIRMLCEHFPLFGQMSTSAYRYNRILADRYFELLDFVELHYRLSAREDDFWRQAKERARRGERLAAKLDFWRQRPPAAPDFEDPNFPGSPTAALPDGGLPGDHRPAMDTGGLFGLSSYEMMLYGSGQLTDIGPRRAATGRPRAKVLETVTAQLRQARATLPRHEHWLQTVCGMPDYG